VLCDFGLVASSGLLISSSCKSSATPHVSCICGMNLLETGVVQMRNRSKKKDLIYVHKQQVVLNKSKMIPAMNNRRRTLTLSMREHHEK